MRKIPKAERHEFETRYDACDSFVGENRRGGLFFKKSWRQAR